MHELNLDNIILDDNVDEDFSSREELDNDEDCDEDFIRELDEGNL